ncbi:hypothetical protein [Yoonia sp. I 8.24]|uniref:hypothetical protein n=1 Tax=Yoonia sp. I 8.24 TaxID=1537229 RepID=UPI001EDF5057|nr:hypothetical protein [Yoonia sp. I 8.24]MCG3267752.1 hypothetical protein [Yoonia sp. I 8.24]
MTSQQRKPFNALEPAQQAGILCNDPQFQKFAATRSGLPDQQFSTSAAAQYLRDCCQIKSRRQLASDPTARTQFQMLRTEFDAWAGRIQSPR